MNIEFDSEDIERISTKVADRVFEKLENSLNSPLLDIDSLAEYLKVPKSWVYEKTRAKSNGSIPRVMVGKYVRFDLREVVEWLKRQ